MASALFLAAASAAAFTVSALAAFVMRDSAAVGLAFLVAAHSCFLVYLSRVQRSHGVSAQREAAWSMWGRRGIRRDVHGLDCTQPKRAFSRQL